MKTIKLTVTAILVVATLVGLGACGDMSRRDKDMPSVPAPVLSGALCLQGGAPLARLAELPWVV